MAKAEFIEQVKALGFTPQERNTLGVCFEYEVPVGRNIGKKLPIGFEIPNDFPMNCPTGPHFMSVGVGGWIEPPNNVNPSPFGNEWRYWSRPFPDWNRTEKTVKKYLAHIKNLLAKL